MNNQPLRRGLDFISALENELPWDTTTQAICNHAAAYHSLMRRLITADYKCDTSRQLLEKELHSHREAISLLIQREIDDRAGHRPVEDSTFSHEFHDPSAEPDPTARLRSALDSFDAAKAGKAKAP